MPRITNYLNKKTAKRVAKKAIKTLLTDGEPTMQTELLKNRRLSGKDREKAEKRIEELRPWEYSFTFGGDLSTRQGTNPLPKFLKAVNWLPESIEGATCLDLPSNNGQLSMALKDRGAKEVTAIDITDRSVNQGKFLAETMGYDINFKRSSIYELPKDIGQFDYVFSFGLLYHLKDMCMAFDILRGMTKKALFLETAVLEIEHQGNYAEFIEGTMNGDGSNWWIPSVPCTLAMMRAAGFQSPQVIDYIEPKMKFLREGTLFPARATFRTSVDNDLLKADKFTVHKH